MAKKKRSREGAETSAPEAEPGHEGKPRGRRARGASAPLNLPKWLPWVVFGVLTVLLFGKFIFSNQMLFGSDTLGLGYMARKFYADAVRGGDFPLWNPDLLGGVPFLEALSGGDSLYPSALLLFVMAPYRALGWKLVLHVFLAGAFMYGWVRRLGASRAAATVAGVAYLLAPFLVTLVWPGGDGKLMVTALTPLLFWAMEATFHRKGLLAYGGVAGAVALVILTTQFQMAYFLFAAAGAYYAFRSVQEALAVSAVGAAADETATGAAWTPALGRFGLFLAASLVGGAIAGVQLIPSFQYATEFSRRTATTTTATPELNKEYAAQWSLHPEEIAALVVPEFVGSDVGGADWTTQTYWGRNDIKFNLEYGGLVVLLLAGVSFFGARLRGLRLFLTAMGALALLYGLGAHTPVWQLAYALLPGVSLFRAAGMVIFLFGFAAATLAGLGVDRLLELKDDPDSAAENKITRFLWIATGVVGVGLLLAASGTLGSLWTGMLYRDIDPAKATALTVDQPFLVRGFLVSTVLAAGTAGLIWAALQGQLPRAGLVGGVALLVVVDLWRVDAPFIQVIDPSRVTQPDPIVAELMKRKATEPPFRVFSFGADQDVYPATFGIELAGGHHPNDLARYRELVGMEGSGAAVNIPNPNVLRLLNVRYLIWPTAQQGGEPTNIGEVVARSMVGEQVYQSLVTYPPALARARLVGAAEVVADDRTVARLLEPTFDPGKTVLLTENPPIDLPGGPVDGAVQWTQDGLDRIQLTVDSPSNALLVVADNWYPAWKATVDGTEAPVLRAYHSLRAVPIAAGHHEVVMWYDAGALRGGLIATVGGLVVLAAVVAFSLISDRRRVADA